MRALPSQYPLLLACVLACNDTPSRPASPTAIATPSVAAMTQGGPPLAVHFKTEGLTCFNVGNPGQDVMTQAVTLHRASNLLLLFSFEWGSLNPDEEGLLQLELDGQAHSTKAFGFAGTATSRTSGTVTWPFPDVPAGTHTVAVHARVEGGDVSAQLNECAFTVLVIPSPGEPK